MFFQRNRISCRMKWSSFLLIAFYWLCFLSNITAQGDTAFWWKRNNLRVIQVNLPDYEARLDPGSLVADLGHYNANTLIINAGGIMAFYPSQLPFQYINPYMQPNMLGDVIKKCHQQDIKVMVRFDFSRVEESIYKQHPDWCYISAKGERIINTNMYAVSINAPYVQQKAFDIVQEVLDKYPIDGVFLNMPGYQTSNAYEGKYYGIDQNEYEKQSFAIFSNGLRLPVEENKNDSIYRKYLEFKKQTTEAWSEKLYALVKRKNRNIAICTYTDKYVDIIRHESQSGMPPYWPYTASDNVGNASNTFPDHIISNSSIQQISFQSRFNAAEPGEVAIRLYENIANGSGLDISMMGDMRGYEDMRNFETIRKIYGFHKKHEAYFGRYSSVAKTLIIAPGAWPSGDAMQEYRGIQLMLHEAHIPFDILEDAQVANRAGKLNDYSLIIVPDITNFDTSSIAFLKTACANGAVLLATNHALNNDSAVLRDVFGASITKGDNDGVGNYLNVSDHAIFKRLSLQTMVMWRYNLGLYDLTKADTVLLPVFSKGRPGPPEIVGGHEPTGYYAASIKKYGKGKAVLMPVNIGRLYYNYGYTEHKNIVLDIIEHVYPSIGKLLQTNAPERVELIPKLYTLNTGVDKSKSFSGMLLHCINITGFSGNSFLVPLPVHKMAFSLQVPFKPSRVYRLSDGKAIPFTWKHGIVRATLPVLNDFETVVMDK